MESKENGTRKCTRSEIESHIIEAQSQLDIAYSKDLLTNAKYFYLNRSIAESLLAIAMMLKDMNDDG